MDNYAVKALSTVLLEFKESRDLYAAYREQIQSTMESDNPWIAILMKSFGVYYSINDNMTNEAIDNMIDSMLRE